MGTDVPLSCRCGQVRGTARACSPTSGVHVTCMCDDCQCFAHWLERADDVLDEWGGTEVFQLAPNQVSIDAGREHIRLMRLSPKGLFRWYTACCRTPLGNTLPTNRAPFVGLQAACMDLPEDERSRALGPILARVNGRYGRPPLPPDAHPRAPFSVIRRSVGLLLRNRLRRRGQPHPFFDAAGEPIVAPEVIALEVRAQLRSRVQRQP